MEKNDLNEEAVNLTIISEGKNHDFLDRPGKVKLAKIHGSAQRVHKVPDVLDEKGNY